MKEKRKENIIAISYAYLIDIIFYTFEIQNEIAYFLSKKVIEYFFKCYAFTVIKKAKKM